MVGHAYSRRRMCSYSATRAGERGTRERAKKQTPTHHIPVFYSITGFNLTSGNVITSGQ